MTTWETAWERDKYEVGRAMHEGWKRQKIANGFAAHPWDDANARERDGQGNLDYHCGLCGKAKGLHHADMIDWDDLPLEQQAINYEGGKEGFRRGFEAGQRSCYDNPLKRDPRERAGLKPRP
jgi:hypothetical protein